MLSIPYVAGFFDGEGSIGIYKAYYRGNCVGYRLRTQLCQNRGEEANELMAQLSATFGGSASNQQKKLNWQLNSEKAAEFLRQILPYLRMKKIQAEVAIAWQEARPKVIRFPDGVKRFEVDSDVEFDAKVSELMKALKTQDVMAMQKDLVDVLHHVKPIINIKGAGKEC